MTQMNPRNLLMLKINYFYTFLSRLKNVIFNIESQVFSFFKRTEIYLRTTVDVVFIKIISTVWIYYYVMVLVSVLYTLMVQREIDFPNVDISTIPYLNCEIIMDKDSECNCHEGGGGYFLSGASSYSSYEEMDQKGEVLEAFNLIAILPASLLSLINKWSIMRQHLYDFLCRKLLNMPYVNKIVILVHTGLFYYRYYISKGLTYIESYINLPSFAIIISVICSRLHIAGSMIILYLLILRLDFAVVAMSRFL